MLLPGDILCTRNKSSWFARMIRLGSALRDEINTVNHVIIFHHVDKAGVNWGIEGRPGGVGWVDIRVVLKDKWTATNSAQPKTSSQRRTICDGAVALLGTPYDWAAIAGDGLDALGLPNPWDNLWEAGEPAQVVCSSAADWLYQQAGLASPRPDRNCKPSDWARFIVEEAWS